MTDLMAKITITDDKLLVALGGEAELIFISLVERECQFRILYDTRQTLIAFYKGTFYLQVEQYNPIRITDAPGIEGDVSDPLLRSLIELAIERESDRVGESDKVCRTVPARILWTLFKAQAGFLIENQITFEILQSGRNGIIENGEIVLHP